MCKTPLSLGGDLRTAVLFFGIQGAGGVCEDKEEAGTFPTLSVHVLEGPSENCSWRTRNPEGRPSLQPGGNEVNSEF